MYTRPCRKGRGSLHCVLKRDRNMCSGLFYTKKGRKRRKKSSVKGHNGSGFLALLCSHSGLHWFFIFYFLQKCKSNVSADFRVWITCFRYLNSKDLIEMFFSYFLQVSLGPTGHSHRTVSPENNLLRQEMLMHPGIWYFIMMFFAVRLKYLLNQWHFIID